MAFAPRVGAVKLFSEPVEWKNQALTDDNIFSNGIYYSNIDIYEI